MTFNAMSIIPEKNTRKLRESKYFLRQRLKTVPDICLYPFKLLSGLKFLEFRS